MYCNMLLSTHMKVMKEEAKLQNLSDFENKSLIIVDDDNPFRERLARAMEKKGFEVLLLLSFGIYGNSTEYCNT